MYEDKETCILPPVETIIEKAKKFKITKEDLMTIKKDYDTNFAKNPPKEIKRLPTLFEGAEEEEEKRIHSADLQATRKKSSFGPTQVVNNTKIDRQKVSQMMDDQIEKVNGEYLKVETRPMMDKTPSKSASVIQYRTTSKVKGENLQKKYENLRRMPFSLNEEVEKVFLLLSCW